MTSAGFDKFNDCFSFCMFRIISTMWFVYDDSGIIARRCTAMKMTALNTIFNCWILTQVNDYFNKKNSLLLCMFLCSDCSRRDKCNSSKTSRSGDFQLYWRLHCSKFDSFVWREIKWCQSKWWLNCKCIDHWHNKWLEYYTGAYKCSRCWTWLSDKLHANSVWRSTNHRGTNTNWNHRTNRFRRKFLKF